MCWTLADAELSYWPAWLEGERADRLFELLREEVEWQQHEVTIAGRRLPCPRLSAWYGDPDAAYAYSGLSLAPLPWTPALDRLRRLAERTTGTPFNSVLANLYRDGCDSMGWHADDEPELGREPSIASLSFGAVRRFVLRHRRRKDLDTVAIELAHGSLLWMHGPTQHHWRHAVPKTRRPVGERLNLTFRFVSS